VAGYDELDEPPPRPPRRPVPASEVIQGILALVLVIAGVLLIATVVLWWWRTFVG
jgi:hypothetical protein